MIIFACVLVCVFSCDSLRGPTGPDGTPGAVIHAVYGNLNDVQIIGNWWRIQLPEEYWVDEKLVQLFVRTTEDAEWSVIAIGYEWRVSLRYVHIYYNPGYAGYNYKILIIMQGGDTNDN